MWPCACGIRDRDRAGDAASHLRPVHASGSLHRQGAGRAGRWTDPGADAAGDAWRCSRGAERRPRPRKRVLDSAATGPRRLGPRGKTTRGQPASVAPLPRRRVLVVDDNVDAAQSLAMLLRILGQDVRTAHDGQSALESARASMPEVAILDIGMPGMNGHELARRLRYEPGGDAVLIVALTGWGQEKDSRRSVASRLRSSPDEARAAGDSRATSQPGSLTGDSCSVQGRSPLERHGQAYAAGPDSCVSSMIYDSLAFNPSFTSLRSSFSSFTCSFTSSRSSLSVLISFNSSLISFMSTLTSLSS